MPIYFAVRCVRCVSLPEHTNFSSHSKREEEEEEVKWIKIVYGISFVDVPIGIVKHNEMFCHRDSTVHYFTCHVQAESENSASHTRTEEHRNGMGEYCMYGNMRLFIFATEMSVQNRSKIKLKV